MATEVLGRVAELAVIDEVLAVGRRGPSVLVLEGDGGIGKTTLWQAAIDRADGYRVLRCRAAQAETRLSFAALTDLLAPVPDAALAALPAPQRAALEVALLRAEVSEGVADPRAIGAGLVSLVAALVADGPLLLAVDDHQWLDVPSARALAFLARRLGEAPVVLLLARRTGEDAGVPEPEAPEVRHCTVGPLRQRDVQALVEPTLGESLTRSLLVRIERAAAGNPYWALEVARAMARDGVPDASRPLPVPDDLRELTRARLRRLPAATRAELLRASALADPTVELLDADALGPAEDAGVVRVAAAGRIEFAHPLLASAVYDAAPPSARRRLHGELAGLVVDPEERARHLTRSLEGPDAAVARALDDAAAHARRRGAPEVSAELLEEAARRTPPGSPAAAERLLRAAALHLRAGGRPRAGALTDALLDGELPDGLRARTLHVRAEVAATSADLGTASALLEQAIVTAGDDVAFLASVELSLAIVCGASLDAVSAGAHGRRAVELAAAAGEPGLEAEARALGATVAVIVGQGVPEADLARALELEDHDRDVPFQQRPSLWGALALEYVGELERARSLLLGLRDRLLARGEEGELAYVLAHLAATALLAGDLEDGQAWADEAERLAALTGSETFVTHARFLRASIRADLGDAQGARADGEAALAASDRAGWGVGSAQSRWALARADLLAGDPAAALRWLAPVVPTVEAIGVYEIAMAVCMPDAIEAMVLVGDLDAADRLTTAMGAYGAARDRPWTLALAGRSRALVASARGDLPGALAAAQEALAAHERLPMPIERGRTLIVLGGVLRRLRRRREARLALEEAARLLDACGAVPWRARAEAELDRLRVRRAPEALTPNERRVAELAASGRTNVQIGQELYMSRRTVEASLARTYRKLGIRSRAELGTRLAAEQQPGR